MATYRYYTIDARFRTPVMEIPFYGTSMDKVMSGAGNFTGTYRLGTGVLRDDFLLASTMPGRHGVVCFRDDVLIWAGVLWSRTYGSDAQTVTVTGQTYESIFGKIPFTADFGLQNSEQNNILGAFINHMQAQTATAFDFGLVTPAVAASGWLRTVVYRASEGHLLQELLSDLQQLQGAPNYTINPVQSVYYLPPALQFQIINPAEVISSGIALEYPGSISKYWYSENASRAGVAAVAKTTDSQYGEVTAWTDNTDLLAAGYPKWYTMQSYSDITSISGLQAAANKQAADFKMPLVTPTFELAPNAPFDGWNKLGQYISMYVTDARFPAGQKFSKRLVGWSVTPSDGEQDENLKIQLESVDS